MEFIGVVAFFVCLYLYHIYTLEKGASKIREVFAEELVELKVANEKLYTESNKLEVLLTKVTAELINEQNKSKEILSQKKSSETRLGSITENLVPFLEKCPYNPKDMHFLSQPLDYLVFCYEAGEIVFLEVKSGASKPSKRQKLLKNIIKAGRVYYEEIRVDAKGVKHKRYDNNEAPLELGDEE